MGYTAYGWVLLATFLSLGMSEEACPSYMETSLSTRASSLTQIRAFPSQSKARAAGEPAEQDVDLFLSQQAADATAGAKAATQPVDWKPGLEFASKSAWCHYTEDIADKNKPRMVFDLNQLGADDNPYSFKLKMQSYNIGQGGDRLSVKRFPGQDCAGDATTVADGSVRVQSRWGQSRAYYRDSLVDTNMCDFGSISVADDDGTQLACCNVMVADGEKRCEVDSN